MNKRSHILFTFVYLDPSPEKGVKKVLVRYLTEGKRETGMGEERIERE